MFYRIDVQLLFFFFFFHLTKSISPLIAHISVGGTFGAFVVNFFEVGNPVVKLQEVCLSIQTQIT